MNYPCFPEHNRSKFWNECSSEMIGVNSMYLLPGNIVETTEVVQKQCGRILFLSPGNFKFSNNNFCKHDFFTFVALRAHTNKHFPELPSNKKSEDSISCNRNCWVVLTDILQSDAS